MRNSLAIVLALAAFVFAASESPIDEAIESLKLRGTNKAVDVSNDQETKKVKAAATVRKEIRSLTSAEIDNYFNALWTYKSTGRMDGVSYMKTYDEAVAQHALATCNSTVDQAHTYGAFLVWHGIFVREFEIALQSIDPSVTVPYWDWTIDSSVVTTQSVIFTSSYFGASSSTSPYEVKDGRMVNWTVSSEPLKYVTWASPTGYLRSVDNANPSGYITRGIGLNSAYTNTPTSTEVALCAIKTSFDTFWSCVWGSAGSNSDQSHMHAGVHVSVGGAWPVGNAIVSGDLTDPATSPNDPLFFSHHAQLDRLWYQWKVNTGDAKATTADPCAGFYGTAVTSPQPSGHNLADTFFPYFYLGGSSPLTVSQACLALQAKNAPYSYAN